MDKEILKRIFEDLLNHYEASEKAEIYEHSSAIEEEIDDLRNKVQKYREDFYRALK